jgi:hypothetical protein
MPRLGPKLVESAEKNSLEKYQQGNKKQNFLLIFNQLNS